MKAVNQAHRYHSTAQCFNKIISPNDHGAPGLKRRLAVCIALSLPLTTNTLAADESSSPSHANPSIEEITVTSSKRTQNRNDFAGSVSVFNQQWLEHQQPLSLQTLAGNTPGFNMIDTGSRNPSPLVIRGLRFAGVDANDLGGDGGSVTRYLDDIPLPGGFIPPDLQLLDLEQVEVLKGPQGTLYGSSSLAGVVRYEAVKPDLNEFATELNASASSTAHSDDLGHAVGLISNLPIANGKAAARIVLRQDEVAGFIDNNYLLSGTQKDINDEEGKQARLSLRWKPVDALTLDASYHYQDRFVGDRQASNEPFTDDPYGASSRYLQPADTKVEMTSISAHYEFEHVEATAIHSRYDYTTQSEADQTDYLLGYDPAYYGAYEDFRAITLSDFDVTKSSTELRLASRDNAPQLQWLLGVFYSEDKVNGDIVDLAPGFDEFQGVNEPRDYYAVQQEQLSESALFGESTYHINPQWQVTLGGRYYEQQDDLEICSAIPMYDALFDEPPTFYCNDDHESDKGFLWKASAQYQVSFGSRLYGVYSEGFRRGGSNALPTYIENNRSYQPDYAEHYELGFLSGDLWQSATLNASIYAIDWQDIQQTAWESNYLVTVNAGTARSLGVELEGRFNLTESWGLAWGAAYNEATLRTPADDIVGTVVTGESGDRLPGSPKEQWHIGLDGQHQFDAFQLDTLVSVMSLGEITTALNDTMADYERLPGFTMLNAHVGAQWGNWYWALDATNLTDERAITSGRHESVYGPQGRFDTITRPRTLSLSVRLSL
ncbi:TonB-dependent receptor [Gilvimarinus agarilyticus]|uniref:TonB-dependent receptor n=1 Tax=Gilvimarinus agarilyticus TaxID=679259 RepID=UPI0018DDED5C|nr:TonB-dependent receptor [Gilvimarinus agarilyticus]